MFIRNIMKASRMLHDSHGSCASRASCGVTKELKTADILRGVEEEMALQLVNCHSRPCRRRHRPREIFGTHMGKIFSSSTFSTCNCFLIVFQMRLTTRMAIIHKICGKSVLFENVSEPLPFLSCAQVVADLLLLISPLL